MASPINNVITYQGKQAIAAAIAGRHLEFTRIEMGSGRLSDGMDQRTLRGVIQPEAAVDISKLTTNNNDTAIIGGIFVNSINGGDFEWRELGLYCLHPITGEEILFTYGNSGDQAEYIPAGETSVIVEKHIDILAYVGDAAMVIARVKMDGYATVEQCMECHDLAQAAYDLASRYPDGLESWQRWVEDQLQRLRETITGGLFTNPWTLTFEDLDGVKLTSGDWNEEMARLEC